MQKDKPIQKDNLKLLRLIIKLQSENKVIKEITEIRKTTDYNFKVFFTDGSSYHIKNYFKKGITSDRKLFLSYYLTINK